MVENENEKIGLPQNIKNLFFEVTEPFPHVMIYFHDGRR